MLGIIGIAVIFVMVFGGYILAGGKMSIILHSVSSQLFRIVFMESNSINFDSKE